MGDEGGEVRIFSQGGAPLGVLDGSGDPHVHAGSEPCGVATDAAGDVYVGYKTSEPPSEGSFGGLGYVAKYVPSGNPAKNADFDSEVTGLLATNVNTGCNVAVSSEYLYWVGHQSGNNRYPISAFPGGGGSADLTGTGVDLSATADDSIFVDPETEDVYIGTGRSTGTVRQYDKAGNLLGSIDIEGRPIEAAGVAVDDSTGKLYVSVEKYRVPAEKQIFVYGPAVEVEPPSASIDPMSEFDFRSAHFSGTVNAEGEGAAHATTYRFQCSPACPGLEGDREVPADGEDHEVSDDAEGLAAETEYTVRLIAENAAGKVEDTTSFETEPTPPAAEAPAATIDPVTEYSATAAHLTGTVDPMGSGEAQETTYRFEYTADGVLWVPGEEQGPIEGSGPQPVSADLTGLEPNSGYSVRLRAENVGGVVFSVTPNPAFTTSPSPPAVEATAATRVLETSAQLNGRVNPLNSETTYYFQWGTADCASNPCASIPLGEDGEAGTGGGFRLGLGDASPASPPRRPTATASSPRAPAGKPRAPRGASPPRRPRRPAPTKGCAPAPPHGCPTAGPMRWSPQSKRTAATSGRFLSAAAAPPTATPSPTCRSPASPGPRA